MGQKITAAQTIATVEISRTSFDNEGDNLHKLANAFADSVGKVLKVMYPAKVQVAGIDICIRENDLVR